MQVTPRTYAKRNTRTKALALAKKQQTSKGAGRVTESSEMKRHGNLYDEVCSAGNLALAHQKARNGVRLFEKDLENNMQQLPEFRSAIT